MRVLRRWIHYSLRKGKSRPIWDNGGAAGQAVGNPRGKGDIARRRRRAPPPGRAKENGIEMKTVAICDTQPITAEGLRAVVNDSPELEFLRPAYSLPEATALVRELRPDLLVVDKGFGVQAVFAWIRELLDAQTGVALIVWGNTISEAEALRLLQTGVRGILRKSCDVKSMLSCLEAVAGGNSWMEESLFHEPPSRNPYRRSELTPRERQVLELVEQGLKNKEIARELGIRPGTVKIHLKHIFEKTGVRGRYGLALSGMKNRGLLSLPHL